MRQGEVSACLDEWVRDMDGAGVELKISRGKTEDEQWQSRGRQKHEHR